MWTVTSWVRDRWYWEAHLSFCLFVCFSLNPCKLCRWIRFETFATVLKPGVTANIQGIELSLRDSFMCILTFANSNTNRFCGLLYEVKCNEYLNGSRANVQYIINDKVNCLRSELGIWNILCGCCQPHLHIKASFTSCIKASSSYLVYHFRPPALHCWSPIQ